MQFPEFSQSTDRESSEDYEPVRCKNSSQVIRCFFRSFRSHPLLKEHMLSDMKSNARSSANPLTTKLQQLFIRDLAL